MSTWDDKPNDYEHALAQIKHLRARNAEHEARHEALEALGLRHDRAAVIEECARMAEEACKKDQGMWQQLPAAIRALKDK